MKRLFILSLLLCLFGTIAIGQKVSFNPKVGVNQYELTDNNLDVINIESDGGFHAGFDLRIGDKIYFQPGLHYYLQRSTYAVDDDLVYLELPIIEDEVAITSQILRVPVVIGTSFLRTDNIKFRAQTGLATMILLDVDEGTEVYGIDRNDYRNFVTNATFGLGIDLSFISFEIAYDLGLSDIFKEELVFNTEQDLLSFSVGIVF